MSEKRRFQVTCTSSEYDQMLECANDENRTLSNYVLNLHKTTYRPYVDLGTMMPLFRPKVFSDRPITDTYSGFGMWQCFTERARKVVFYAQEEAQKLGGRYVATEHLLFGLLRETDCIHVTMIEHFGIPQNHIWSSLERQCVRGKPVVDQNMSLAPRAKRCIDLAWDEARSFGNNYLGTEHLLLGILRERGGLAARVLFGLGFTLERAREMVPVLQEEYRKALEEFSAD